MSLAQAVSDEKWDAAFKNNAPFNENMTIGELKEYAKYKQVYIELMVNPDFFKIQIVRCDDD